MQYKRWVDNIARIRGVANTRLDKIRLDKNERLEHFPDEFWIAIISKMTQEHVFSYPEVEPLYLKLAAFLNLTPENLLITAGSDFAIRTVFDLFVKPGDKVIIMEPTFAMVDVYCGLYNANRVAVGYDSTLRIDMDRLLSNINEKISLIILANPNSPTGTYIPNHKISIILKKANHFSIPVLIDEAYYGFCPYTSLDLLDEFENLIITRTFSKTAGLAGLRIGYIIAHKNLAGLLYKFRPMYEVNSIAVLFASELLDNWILVEQYIKKTDQGKKYLLQELYQLSFSTIDTYANFIHVNFSGEREKIVQGFERDGILVRGSLGMSGFERYTRISVGNMREMQKIIDSIVKTKGLE